MRAARCRGAHHGRRPRNLGLRWRVGVRNAAAEPRAVPRIAYLLESICMRRALLIAFLSLGVATNASDGEAAASRERPQGSDGQWTMPGQDFAATRYSALAEINTQTAVRLHPLWTF